MAKQSTDAAPRRRAIKEQAVSDITGVPLPTIQKWRMQGKGPRFMKLGTGARSPVRYFEDDVYTWLESCRMASTGQRERVSA
jgi:predicted DNA-binding transcriptional regulator AlpA